jgi:hypothetical protein
VPIAWLQLPVRCGILRGTDALELAIHSDSNKASSSSSSAAAAAAAGGAASSPAPAFPAAVLSLGGGGGGSPAPAASAASAGSAASAASAAAASPAPAARAASKGAGGAATTKRVDGLLVPKDIVRVGANDEDYERVVSSLALTDPTGAGQKGVATLATAWAGENQRKALLFKKHPATRKRAYADLLLAKERERKGAASEIHEAGFSSIFALLEGHDQNCRCGSRVGWGRVGVWLWLWLWLWLGGGREQRRIFFFVSWRPFQANLFLSNMTPPPKRQPLPVHDPGGNRDAMLPHLLQGM